MYFLYGILFYLFALVYLPLFAAKGKFGKGASSRFGSVPESVREALKGRSVVWVHAVSVGEMGLAVRLVDRLRDRLPEAKFLLTTTTTTGYAVGNKIKNEEDVLLYFPIDFSWSVKRFLDAVHPSALLLLETELWPNLIREAARRSVPVLILNGRISDRAFKDYAAVKFFLRGVFRHIAGVSAQDARMQARFTALGAPADRVAANGNLKYDWEPSPAQEELASSLKRAVRAASGLLTVAGSTHEGEEELFLRLYGPLRQRFPQLRLLLAPRHLERMGAIERTAERLNVRTRRVSAASAAALGQDVGGEVWLLDQLGALAPLYECADLVFIGGSLVPVGGHNLVEPAFYGRPVLFGPHMANFSEMAGEFKSHGAALEVADARSLEVVWEDLLRHPEKAGAMGRAARELVRRHQGATQRSLDWAAAYLNERSLVNA